MYSPCSKPRLQPWNRSEHYHALLRKKLNAFDLFGIRLQLPSGWIKWAASTVMPQWGNVQMLLWLFDTSMEKLYEILFPCRLQKLTPIHLRLKRKKSIWSDIPEFAASCIVGSQLFSISLNRRFQGVFIFTHALKGAHPSLNDFCTCCWKSAPKGYVKLVIALLYCNTTC